MTTKNEKTMVASTASRDRYKIQRFPSGWYGYCGKTRVKEFSTKASAESWLRLMNRQELVAAETRDGAIEALFDVTFGERFDEVKHEIVYNDHTKMWHIYTRPVDVDADGRTWDERFAASHQGRVHAANVKRRAKREKARAKRRQERDRKLQNPEARDILNDQPLKFGAAGAAKIKFSGGQVVSAEPVFKQRYINVTAITETGSPISTQCWCVSSHDLDAVRERIIGWTNPDDERMHGKIVRVWMFDTYTQLLLELAPVNGELKLITEVLI